MYTQRFCTHHCHYKIVVPRDISCPPPPPNLIFQANIYRNMWSLWQNIVGQVVNIPPPPLKYNVPHPHGSNTAGPCTKIFCPPPRPMPRLSQDLAIMHLLSEPSIAAPAHCILFGLIEAGDRGPKKTIALYKGAFYKGVGAIVVYSVTAHPSPL